MIPHIARWIVGPDQRWILSYSVILSPILLLVSDVIGRSRDEARRTPGRGRHRVRRRTRTHRTRTSEEGERPVKSTDSAVHDRTLAPRPSTLPGREDRLRPPDAADLRIPHRHAGCHHCRHPHSARTGLRFCRSHAREVLPHPGRGVPRSVRRGGEAHRQHRGRGVAGPADHRRHRPRRRARRLRCGLPVPDAQSAGFPGHHRLLHWCLHRRYRHHHRLRLELRVHGRRGDPRRAPHRCDRLPAQRGRAVCRGSASSSSASL